jgi:CheY-like chemotaxis protein
MDEATKARVFEPFFTTKKQGEGTGLGLATVYGLVKQNQGFINVYSEPRQGSTFRIYFPAHDAPAVHDSVDASERRRSEQGTETILLVEDEIAILKLGCRILERLGYRVLAAATPDEAMRLAEEHAGAIDLLVTDVIMPGMNGRELAQGLVALYPDLKLLFMSGYTADVIAHQGVLEDGFNFIEKPFSVESLGKRIREVLDGIE